MSTNSPINVLNCFEYEGGQIIELEFCKVMHGASTRHRNPWYLIHACYRTELTLLDERNKDDKGNCIRIFNFDDVYQEDMVWTLTLDNKLDTVTLYHNKGYNPIVHNLIGC